MTKRNGHGQSPTAAQPIKPGRRHKQNQASKVRASGVSLSSPGSSIPHGPRRDELPKLFDPAGPWCWWILRWGGLYLGGSIWRVRRGSGRVVEATLFPGLHHGQRKSDLEPDAFPPEVGGNGVFRRAVRAAKGEEDVPRRGNVFPRRHRVLASSGGGLGGSLGESRKA
ncbi:hypothetical protein BC629DRAFT_1441189 [Irpex lacteus]|nr:hypothetical protein BC629DRAFT_1441189 [Irpex lacteus]